MSKYFAKYLPIEGEINRMIIYAMQDKGYSVHMSIGEVEGEVNNLTDKIRLRNKLYQLYPKLHYITINHSKNEENKIIPGRIPDNQAEA